MTEMILHSANIDHSLPTGSLVALEESLLAGVSHVEVDVIPLPDGDFAMLHDPILEHISEASGEVAQYSSKKIQSFRYKNSPHTLGTLSQAVKLIERYPLGGFFQLDLKPYAPLTPKSMGDLLRIIEPIHELVMVSSVADWAIRLLKRMSPTLKLGFDPLLYLDLVEDEPREEGIPPFRVGAYGYLDDHPLATQRWGSLKDYFEARAEALIHQVPSGITWFINAQLLSEANQAGFNWVDFLQKNGNSANAWTLDMERVALAQEMVALGVDYITTNQLLEMKKALAVTNGR
jgi:glycerophosphoryl diester phosphodiesterase